jgi:hypothetical protein
MHSTTYDNDPSRRSRAVATALPDDVVTITSPDEAVATTYTDQRLRTMTWQTVHAPDPSRDAQSLNSAAQSGGSRRVSERGTVVSGPNFYPCWSARCTQRDIPVEDGYRSTNLLVGFIMKQPRLHTDCYHTIFARQTVPTGTGDDRDPPSGAGRNRTMTTTPSGPLTPPSNGSQG